MTVYPLSDWHTADADLLTRIGIAMSLRLCDTQHAIHVRIDSGHVTLRGLVACPRDHRRVLEVVRHVAGVLHVHDELTVTKPASLPATPRGRLGTTVPVASSRGPGALLTGSLTRWLGPWRTSAVAVLRGLLLGLCVVGLTGCGSGPDEVTVYPVSGKITFQGQPIPGAVVTLHPQQATPEVPNPRASVSRSGEFQVSTFAGGDGAPAGNYRVTVVWYKPIKVGNDLQAGPNVIPKKYARPQTSDLLVQVTAGPTALPPIRL